MAVTHSSSQKITHEGPKADTNVTPLPRRAQAGDNPYLAGEVIGDRYRLVREIGSGGMGVVWVAHSLVLGVDVALKLIRASVAGPALSSRMAREAHAAARLGHPALVRVFDFGWTSRGDPFLVMELVLGETLSALLEREVQLPAIRTVQLLLPIADGLRLAHDKSIIHRDIKPENIFISSEALGRVQPKLLDFGIAKIGHNRDSRLTQVGVVLGSPEYMSPEQALGLEDIDERTDVWSFCIVLYEMLTGTTPFKNANYNALMQSIINRAPLPLARFGIADDDLWRVIERGLTKDRDQRWANMTELGEALALWLYEHGMKEDISGNSLRAVWLDMGLTGVKVDIPESAFPNSSGGRRVAASTADDLEVLPQQYLLTDRPEPSATQAGRRARKHQWSWPFAAAALGGAVLTALIIAVWPKPEPLPTVVAPVLPEGPAASASALQPSPSAAAAASAVDDYAHIPTMPLASTASSSSARPLTRPATKPAPSPRPTRSGKRNHDFGF